MLGRKILKSARRFLSVKIKIKEKIKSIREKRPYRIIRNVGIFIVASCIPFLIERILFEETIFLFSMPISLSREIWFSFVGSYLGAIGAVALGVMAMNQTKRYNDSSNDMVKRQQALLENIKDINQQHTDKLLRHKYYDNFIAYIQRLEKNYTIIKYYSAGWFKRFIAKKILNDPQTVDGLIDLDEQKERMHFDLMEIDLMFGEEWYFFEGKFPFYDSYMNYKKLVLDFSGTGNEMDRIALEYNISISAKRYKDLLTKYHTYVLEVKRRSLELLEEDMSIKEIKENLEIMKNTHKKWLENNQIFSSSP